MQFAGVESIQKLSHFMTRNIVKICKSWKEYEYNMSHIYFLNDKKEAFYFNVGELVVYSIHKEHDLRHVIDITSTNSVDYALCDCSERVRVIANDWFGGVLPADVMNLIFLFHSTNQVFHRPHGVWQCLDALDDLHVTSIAATKDECFYLNTSGDFRRYDYHKDCVLDIDYFAFRGIRIKKVSCGFYHCLCLDFEGNVYSFGRNRDSQCGVHPVDKYDDTPSDEIKVPMLVDTLKEVNIVRVKCGGYHSYAMSEDRRHFLFGDNYYFQCLLMDEKQRNVTEPMCVNEIFLKITKGVRIKDVFLGNGNTVFLTQ